MMSNGNRDLWLLRTAAGSAPAVSQIDYFHRLGVRIIAADSDPLSVGLFAADRGYCVPRATARDYVDTLVTLCAQNQVTAFLPALDEELVPVCEAQDRFSAVGTKVLLSSVETLETCTDKWALHQFFCRYNFPTVSTRTGTDAYRLSSDLTLPQFIKPRRGRGSTNVFVAHTVDELKFFIKYVNEPVVQPYISGVEYTIDVLADWNSEAVIIAPRRRIAAESGISYKGQLVWNTEMVRLVREMARALKLIGPANIQCFISDEGQLLFTEVNARLAGSSILTAAAGIPLYEGILDMIRGETPRGSVEPVQDMIMLRYWAELYVPGDHAKSFGWKP